MDTKAKISDVIKKWADVSGWEEKEDYYFGKPPMKQLYPDLEALSHGLYIQKNILLMSQIGGPFVMVHGIMAAVVS